MINRIQTILPHHVSTAWRKVISKWSLHLIQAGGQGWNILSMAFLTPHNCLRIANAVCVVMFINIFALEQKWYILRAAFLTSYTFLRILKAVHVVMFIKVFALIWMLFLFRCKIPLFLLLFPRVEHVKQRDRSISLQYASSTNNAEIILEDCREGIKLN